MGNEQAKSEVATGFGIQSMDQHLQRKFSKGIQFNMKIVIKGDRNSGKTSLFQRLQGKPFQESYIPTDEIQVSSILWSYKETQDTVKVEVWDVVDKGKSQKKKKQGKLKMFNDPVQDPISQPLDAQFLDVYKGTHGVIFMFDMTKQWTYQYVTRELPLVPYHIPIIVLANFRDMGEHRVVSNLEAINFVELLERPEGSADIRYAECSMKDGFGLKYLHKFFSIPFLHLQQESLLQQLQVNRELLVSTIDELTIDENSEEQNYELFKEAVAQRMKQKEKRIAEEKAAAAAAAAAMANTDEQSTNDKGKETTQPPPAPVVQQPSPSESAKRSSFRAKLSQKFSNKKLSPVTAKKEPTKAMPSKVSKASGKDAVANIDDFVPDEEIDTNFLTEEGDEEHLKKESDDSDDDVIDNPLVAGDEDIDSEEDEPAPSKPVAMVADTKSITDDDDDEVNSTDKKHEQKIPITSVEQQKRSPELTKQQKASPKPAEHQKTSPKPVKPVKPVTTRPALVSAKSVELTESSSEDDDNEAEQLVQARKKQPIKPVKETVAPAPKFSGLKLEHSLPASTPPKKADPPEEESGRVKDKESSASIAKKEKKKSRTKKKKQREEVDDKDDVKQNTPVIAAVTTDTAVANDPFSSSLLDAWLDSPTGDPLAPILQPTSMRKSEKVGSDQTTDATEEKKKHKHKKHKHKHKHSETSASGEKKRQKHREPSTTTESSEPAGNDYVALL